MEDTHCQLVLFFPGSIWNIHIYLNFYDNQERFRILIWILRIRSLGLICNRCSINIWNKLTLSSVILLTIPYTTVLVPLAYLSKRIPWRPPTGSPCYCAGGTFPVWAHSFRESGWPCKLSAHGVERLTVPLGCIVRIPDDQKNLLTGSSSAWEKPKGVCIPIETIKSSSQVPIATGSWKEKPETAETSGPVEVKTGQKSISPSVSFSPCLLCHNMIKR